MLKKLVTNIYIMTKKLVSLKDVEGSETNPFTIELKNKMYLQPRANTIIAKGQALIDTTTGEIMNETILIGKRKVMDKSQHAKLYASEIGILYELSKAGQNVFLHLTKVMDYDNKAIFDYKKEYTKLGYSSEMQPLKGLRELITRNIIAPHVVSNIYWLNPTIVCKGERFAKYIQFVTEEEAKREEEWLMKKQGIKTIEALPQSVADKVNYARQAPAIDSNNQYHPNQTFFNFEEEQAHLNNNTED